MICNTRSISDMDAKLFKSTNIRWLFVAVILGLDLMSKTDWYNRPA